MAFVIIKNSQVRDITSGTAQVSSSDSYQSGYPFSNAYDEWDKPWLEWRASYSDSNAHTISLVWSGLTTRLVILGANFETITYSSTTYTLSRNRLVGDYRAFFSISGISGITFTIPAQATTEGYFKIGSIVVNSGFGALGSAVYPASFTLVQPASDVITAGGRNVKQKTGRKHHIIEYRNHYRDYDYLSAINQTKVAQGLTGAFVFYENRDDYSKVYLVKRLADMGYQERGNNDFEYVLRMEELA